MNDLQDKADEILARIVQVGNLKPVSISPSDTERWERMREANREMYDLLRRVVANDWRRDYEVLNDVMVCLSRIDGDTK